MNNILSEVYNYFKKNKYFCFLLLFLLAFYTYCCFNTFIINDDLPYSLFHRTSTRVTNIKQVILNQYSDYFNINSRVIIHGVVQFLLIFGKTLWSILNPLIIVLSFILMYKIINLSIKDCNKFLSLLLISSIYLILIKYKKIIFWVAGSVNYVWVGLYLLFLLYLYLKYGYSKRKILNILLILSISILHEYLLVFSIVFILINYIRKIISTKKIINQDILYFLPLIISYIFLMKSPAVIGRLNENQIWNELSIFEKIFNSFPIISKNFIDLTNINNILPIIFLMILLISLFKIKNKYSIALSTFMIINIVAIFIFENNLMYLLLSILILLSVLYYNYIYKRKELSIIFISMYSIVYSMGLTAEYNTNRSSYIVYIFMIILLIIMIYDLINKNIKIKKYFTFAILILFLTLVSIDLHVYSVIGNVSRERISKINDCKVKSCETLELKKIPDKYEFYHMDINSPSDNKYFAFNDFVHYYELKKDIVIKLYD